ncbi:CRISPR-associated helicase/endonuclease Cas3 [Paenibacillus durus]|uniref:CRISPR-associated protein Cas3 n=1 Tax=Paenibacillus durus TaxID=44251 RepID=A0A089IRQ1_PAEDU|nr:CRISPR-associated helicase/endonuclease Cas3 [Paenibacillus durus]AIQ11714.1 CRISPR-associated protein Cas3 [Paenibacillus durus]
MEYIAHIRQKDKKIQTVGEHQKEVQVGCEHYGAKIGVSHLAGLAGMLHDIGKNTNEFNMYLVNAVYHPQAAPRKGSVDHSTAGGRLLHQRYHKGEGALIDNLAAEWIGNCIISHHQGLRDFLSPQLDSPYLKRVEQKELDEYDRAVAAFYEQVPADELDRYFEQAIVELEHALTTMRESKLPRITLALLIKYIFSCLIDADRTNTRDFEADEHTDWIKDHHPFFLESYNRLLAKIAVLDEAKDADHPINCLRREMSRQCEEFALLPSGIYTLSIPTGGGKTLSSLRYALRHALETGKERIIYIVPFTTIIEQNAREIREILQNDDMVLEHHSNVADELDPDSDDYELEKEKLKLARDHWDRPIIFTTMVQFLNTFYAKGTRNARRLHQLSNTVLIFDEVQAVPYRCLSLFNAALNFLHTFGKSSIVLCTATQPALDDVRHKLHLSEQSEMIKNLSDVGRHFKRVELVDYTAECGASGWGAETLASFVRERMNEVNSVLVILNTKTAVRKLFAELEQAEWVEEGKVRLFHLSTNMCAAHRKDRLAQVIGALDPEANERVICVSTQLIEAGVNISFDCVIRSLSGLDSIAQAAGRCNRHGKDPLRQVYIIQSADENLNHLQEIKIGAEMTRKVLDDFRRKPELYENDLLSPSATKAYFKYYYHRIKDELDYPVPKLGGKKLFSLLGSNKDYYGAYENRYSDKLGLGSMQALATAEQYFEVIDNAATSIIVPYNAEARELIANLNGELDIRELGDLLRKAQQYVVNVYKHDLVKLDKSGELFPLLNGNVLALHDTAYSERFGVGTEGDGEWDLAMA